MSVSERLRILSDVEKNLNVFAKKTGVPYNSLHNVVNKGANLSSQSIESIASTYPKLNLRWLLLGEGEMWLKEEREDGDLSGKDFNESNEKQINRLNDLLEKRVNLLEQELKELDPDIAKKYGID